MSARSSAAPELPSRHRSGAPRRLLASLALLALTACGGGEGPGFALPRAGASGPAAGTLDASGLEIGAAAEWRSVQVGRETRPALVTAAAGWRWRGPLPRRPRLVLGVAVLPSGDAPPGPVDLVIETGPEAHRRVLERVHLPASPPFREAPGTSTGEAPGTSAGTSAEPDAAAAPATTGGERGSRDGEGPGAEDAAVPSPEPRWHDLEIDLDEVAGGRGAEVHLAARLEPAAPGPGPRVAWAPLRLAGTGPHPGRGADPRPNVLVIVVDTLRADHLPSYGYGRDTAPRIHDLLARRGTLFEQARVQASWTQPSALSYLTGRYPEALGPPEVVGLGVPEGVPTLAELLRARGYRTAAYIANPVLHRGNGFARGFDTFYTPEASVRSLFRHGDALTERALPWIASHAGAPEPFFLYVHYLDPHDPYDNPDVTDGRSPFYPDYEGPVDGAWPHALHAGRAELPDPETGVRQLTALYDSEIRYADRQVGRLLDALPAEVLEDTLVILTADHGEELADHGGWKHGPTVYDEVIRVPWIVRWDGRVAAGRRVDEPVELVDLVPTVLAATADGGEPEVEAEPAPPPNLDGVDLLPVLTAAERPPRRPAFSHHLAGGPLRASVVVDGWKLLLFNRAAPFETDDPLQRAIHERSLQRMERVELYNLEQDPGETRNLAGEEPTRVARLAATLQRWLDRSSRPGLRLALGGVGEGSVVRGRLRLERAPEGWWPELLVPGDRVELEGRILAFEIGGGAVHRGVRVLGDTGAVEALEVALDGEPVPAGRIRVGEGTPYAGGRVSAGELVAASWPLAGRASPPPVLALWRLPPAEAEAAAAPEESEESLRRLRALGYVQ